jgi:hypothetical protein
LGWLERWLHEDLKYLNWVEDWLHSKKVLCIYLVKQ